MTDYRSLITPHYRQKPRLMGLLQALLTQVEDLFRMLDSFPEVLDMNHAQGVLLDQTGALLALPRPSPDLADEDYRQWLRARLARCLWDGSQETLPAALALAFPGRDAVMEDHMDLSVSLSLEGDEPKFPLAELFPVPAGVRTK